MGSLQRQVKIKKGVSKFKKKKKVFHLRNQSKESQGYPQPEDSIAEISESARIAETHWRFKQLYGKLGRKVVRLERKAEAYVKEGPPKRIRQEMRHFDYLFAQMLGEMPRLY